MRLAVADEPAPTALTPDTLTLVVDSVQTLRYRLGEVIAALPDLAYALLFILDRLTDNRDPLVISKLLAGLVAILGAAALAEWLFRQLFGVFATGLGNHTYEGDFRRLGELALLALFRALGLVVFALAALGGYLLLHPEAELVQRAFWGLLLVLLGARFASVLARLLLAPRQPDLRLPAIDTHTARTLFRWLVALVAITLSCAVFGQGLHLFGLTEPLRLLIGVALIALVTVTSVLFVTMQHHVIGRLLGLPAAEPRHSPSGLTAMLAGKWHVFLATVLTGMGIYAIICVLLTLQSQAARMLGTLGVLAAVPAVDGLLKMTVRHLVPPVEALASLSANMKSSPIDDDYAPVIIRNLRIVLTVGVVFLIARLWNIDVALIAADSLGSRTAHALVTIGVTLIVAFAIWGVIKTAINRWVPREELEPLVQEEVEGGGTGLSRVETLLPLLRKFLFAVLVAMAAMICISALGVDIGPLLAGAGVVGIAIGFGAQALVRDIVSGIFFLIDDAFRTGEYIETGGVGKGTVEKISIRSLRLRHHLGQIHTIPFGEIKNVTNYSRDWVIMKLELRVPFDTDLEQVRKLVKSVGKEMLEHPEMGPNFLQPLKSQGVHRMDDSGFIVRVKFMAKPGEQFVIRREVYRRLQEAFKAKGIQFAPRRVIVDAAPGAALTGQAAAAIADGQSRDASQG
ncbi:MAG: mechanosensitive ion channel family protein [Rhodospirillales bacterium]